ncbi:MAG TPA: type I methionyl aminopeptidase [Methylomirabilota bacterium]|jgi:methionyl aminopeptidase|nr:type I methionyl aminopeptidase [Methylomirabilota bacterium]
MIDLKSAREIELMRRGGHILADVMDHLSTTVKAGMSTLEIDEDVEAFITDRGAKPAFKGYRGFPATVCISINEEVVHGIPSPHRRLKEGDIVGLDLGCIVDGYYADCAFTMAIGEVPPPVQKLLDVTRGSLELAIETCRPGRRLSDVSHAVQKHVEAHGFAVVRAFVGHGIGRALHEEPQVPNFGEPGRGPELRPGMVLAIEPMVTMGGWEVRILDDGWTAVTKDGSLAAHFEHTVAVAESGPDVLTRRRPSEGGFAPHPRSEGADTAPSEIPGQRGPHGPLRTFPKGCAGGAGARTERKQRER